MDRASRRGLEPSDAAPTAPGRCLSPLIIGATARSAVAEFLADSFDGYVGMMRCSLGAKGWAMDFSCETGPGARLDLGARFSTYLAAAPMRWTLWDPLNVAPEDRNSAKIIDNRLFGDVDIVRNLYVPANIDRLSHLMMIVSCGPRLLAWMGIWRERPFDANDAARLEAYHPELRERLATADDLTGATVTWSIVESALEALEQPAYLVTRGGTVELANAAGTALLRRENRRTLGCLLQAMQKGDPEWLVTPIRDAGVPEMALVVSRPSAAAYAFAQRLARAETAWKLTKTESVILGMLARGGSNKEIASAGRRSERTVELHVSALLRKAGVDSRSRLLVRFWDWPGPG